MNDTALLDAVGLTCFRGERLLFEALSVSVREGEIVQVHGPNGSGKTTLLRVLCGLTLPSSGTITWRGVPVTTTSPHYRRELQYLGHSNGVKLELTGFENLRVWTELRGRPAPLGIERAMRRFSVDLFADVPTRTLSAGQRRRLALCRLLVSHASLWVLDEPFSSLDRAGADTLHAVLGEHLSTGGSVVLTSHHPLDLPGGAPRDVELAA